MFYRLSDQIALRSWMRVEGAYYQKGIPTAQPLTRREFDTLKLCDGEHDLEPGGTLASLAERGLILPCRQGEHPSEWSAYRHIENRYFPQMNLMITGKCNYNCLHCFNAADNAPLMSEWTFEELCRLLDQARDCGIHAFTVTGGEPMVHKRFMDILREIHRRDMFVMELNTNSFS
ncbi:MAG: radical SAM protein [Clostridia bacterium]|nr:radical SAM protein [Clostridia bacterium]